jgi:uncharacterized membrane protein (UPF0136 family)
VDRRLAWFVVAFGVLVIVGATIGFLKGSSASLASGGPIGVGLVAAGLLSVRGLRIGPPAALALCALTALVMALRLHQTGSLVPALPVGLLAAALVFAILADRRRRSAGRPGP